MLDAKEHLALLSERQGHHILSTGHRKKCQELMNNEWSGRR